MAPICLAVASDKEEELFAGFFALFRSPPEELLDHRRNSDKHWKASRPYHRATTDTEWTESEIFRGRVV